MTPRRWFDAHLDLACLAECGRDMDAAPERAGGPWQPASLTLASLCEGRVAAFMGTIFTEADGDDAVQYRAGDPESAHAAGVRQLGWYRRWIADGKMVWGKASSQNPSPREGMGRERPGLHDADGSSMRKAGPPQPLPLGGVQRGKASRHLGTEASSEKPRLFLLMECADPVRTVDELDWWFGQGVRAIGLAWARGSRYAGGNTQAGVGLTPEGRRLIERMNQLGVIHDLSHLSQRATEEALDLPGRVIASHSNCRALLDEKNERHITDSTIRAIASRGGVIGLNLCRNFIRKNLGKGDRPTVAEAVRHVEHISQLVGHRRAVGLGSDLDGGFSADDLPAGIQSPRDFVKLAEGLGAVGWSDAEIDGFAWGNWARFWGIDPAPTGA